VTRKYWLALTPSLLMAAGILVSTYIAGLTQKSGWLVLAAPLLLSLVILAADVLSSRLRGKPSGPSLVALLLAGSFFLASLIVIRDPTLVKILIPINGAAAWVSLQRPNKQRRTCTTA
jgi:uncharacterized protein YqgC (DUF456 family)